MENILLAIDATKPDSDAFEFACYIGSITKSKITGVFLENFVKEKKPLLERALNFSNPELESAKEYTEQDTRKELIEKNITFFKDSFARKGVDCLVHRDRGTPIHEVIEESRFADILITDSVASFSKHCEGNCTNFVKDILKQSECPVIISPESFEGVEEIMFTYNGSASSIFAIKQFTYLLPSYHNTRVTILQVNEEGKWQDPGKYKLKEWLKDHYSDFHFEVLKGETEKALLDYLLVRKNIFIVMGAYGRATLLRLFSKSQADLLIKTINEPVFIAHIGPANLTG